MTRLRVIPFLGLGLTTLSQESRVQLPTWSATLLANQSIRVQRSSILRSQLLIWTRLSPYHQLNIREECVPVGRLRKMGNTFSVAKVHLPLPDPPLPSPPVVPANLCVSPDPDSPRPDIPHHLPPLELHPPPPLAALSHPLQRALPPSRALARFSLVPHIVAARKDTRRRRACGASGVVDEEDGCGNCG